MSFPVNDEHEAMTQVLADFLAQRSPETEVRRLMDAGGAADPAVWSAMAEMGLQGLIIGESYGGGGLGYRELVAVLERAGAALLIAPLMSSALAASALIASDDESLRAQYLPGLASGQRVGTLALAGDEGRWDVDSIETTAEPDGDAYRLSGVKCFVVDGQHADTIIASAHSETGVGLFVVDAAAVGVTVSALKTLDRTRPQARVEFRAAPARALSTAGAGQPLLDRVMAVAGICLAAEQVGGAQRCLDMAVEYAKVRVQFGKPIGSFQAIKHKCADMLVAVESARSAVHWAAGVLDDGENATLASTLAQAHCSAAYTEVAGQNIQIHGGIGFTWEHPAHLYFKRAKSSEMLFGDPAIQRERLADLVGI